MVEIKIFIRPFLANDVTSAQTYVALCERGLSGIFRDLRAWEYCPPGVVYTGRKWKYLKRELREGLKK